jgi:hypothetical protein
MREVVSSKRVKRAWDNTKRGLEFLHLTEFLLHLSRSDALALLILALTRPVGWGAIGFLAVVWSVWFKVRNSQEVRRMDDHEKEETRELVPPTAEAGELTIVAPNVSQNLADLARQGIGVKITIELKPVILRLTPQDNGIS